MENKTKFKILGVEIEDKSKAYYSTPAYTPTQKQQTVITNTWTRFSDMRTNRDLTYRWFGKKRDGTYRNLIQYINVCEKRWNSDGVARTDLEDWQSSVFKPETRNKIIAILSAVAQQRPGMKFKGVEKSDFLREQIFDDLYTWSENKDNGDEMAIYTMLDALIHGTAIRYEGYEDCKRVLREIEPGSGYDDIKFKKKTTVDKKILTKEARLQDFYFGSMMTRRMDEQPDCVWRKLMRIKDFKKEFAGWDAAKYVLPGGDLTDETFFSGFTSDEVRDENSDLVEVVRYYNKESDQFIILANGVWVNPLKDETCPLPFSHKELPFFSVVFEPLASDFPYGKAAPDKYLNEQDAINALLNMALDQAFVSIHPPMISASEDTLDDVDLTPGKINYVGGDIDQIKEMTVTPPQNAHFNLLSYLHQSIQDASVDSVQSGQTGEAGTATEVRTARDAAMRSFLLFLSFVAHGYKRQAKLRMSNILQFLTTPTSLTKILGEDGDDKFEEAFGEFLISKTKLSYVSIDNIIIEIVGDQKKLEENLNKREELRKEYEPNKTEKWFI